MRHAVEAESRARQALATEATRGVRLSALDEDLRRIEARLVAVGAELAEREHELERAEQEFHERQEIRRQVEEERAGRWLILFTLSFSSLTRRVSTRTEATR